MQNDLTWIVGLVATGLGILSTIIAYQKGVKTEAKREGQDSESLKKDIHHIKEDLLEVKNTTKETNQAISKWTERIVKLEECQKNATEDIKTIKTILRKRGEDVV